MKRITAAGIFVFACMQLAMAQKPSIVTSNEEGWQKIGETTVNFKNENESIVVMGADEFSSLKLKVTDAPISIERLQVFYESGEMQELKVDSELLPGAETEEFALDHKDREIQKVAFTYRTVANKEGERAHLELHGLKTDVNNSSDAYRTDRAGMAEDSTIDSAGTKIREGTSDFYRNADSVKQETQEAAENMKNEIDTAVNDASNYIDRKSADADSAVNHAGEELNDAAENIEDNIEDGAERVENDIEETTGDVNRELSEENNKSNQLDKVYEGKVGPEGQVIYIDKQNKYYYLNDEGKKVIIGKDQLKRKTVD